MFREIANSIATSVAAICAAIGNTVYEAMAPIVETVVVNGKRVTRVAAWGGRKLVRGSTWCGRTAAHGSALVAAGAVDAVMLPLQIVFGRKAAPGAEQVQANAAAIAQVAQQVRRVAADKAKPRAVMPEKIARAYAKALLSGDDLPDTGMLDLSHRVWIALMTTSAARTILALPPEIVAAHMAGAKSHPALHALPNPDVGFARHRARIAATKAERAPVAAPTSRRPKPVVEDDEPGVLLPAPFPAWG
jgi:hypothetical protein